jgi:hypothetical protein
MNTVNRVVIVVLLLAIMALCTISLLFPVRMLDSAAGSLTALADSIRQYERLSPEWFVRVGVGGLFALALDIVIVLLLTVEVRRPVRKSVEVEKSTGGKVLVSLASIADRLRYEVDGLANVLRAKPKVSARRKGVVVEMEVETAAGVDVPVKAEQIVETVRQVVEESMGLKLARPPKVNLRAIPYPKTAKAPARPKVPELPAAPEEPSFAEIPPMVVEDLPPAPSEEDQ